MKSNIEEQKLNIVANKQKSNNHFQRKVWQHRLQCFCSSIRHSPRHWVSESRYVSLGALTLCTSGEWPLPVPAAQPVAVKWEWESTNVLGFCGDAMLLVLMIFACCMLSMLQLAAHQPLFFRQSFWCVFCRLNLPLLSGKPYGLWWGIGIFMVFFSCLVSLQRKMHLNVWFCTGIDGSAIIFFVLFDCSFKFAWRRFWESVWDW